ncbi:hypothetical protein EDB80DRAFT_717523 [Ilyonectria destructans]|nr:hypothetical protein EDB80DRAFT_717523 [Ilyonectria destructans]
MATQSQAADAHESRKSTIIAIVSSVLTVAFLLVSMRVYTRAVLLRNFGFDDWCCIFAFISTLACGALIAQNTTNGLGAHQSTLSEEELTEYLKIFYWSILTYNIALAAIKMTFLLQYYRAMTTHKLKKAYIAALVVVGLWSLSQIFLQAFTCTPVKAFWDKTVSGSCIPSNPTWYINAAGNIVTDVLILILPLPIILKLKLGRRQKYILMSILCLGFFTCTISIIRIRFLSIEGDGTWRNVDTAGWSIGELCSGIVCACLPTIRPLVSRYLPTLFTLDRSSAGHQDSRSELRMNQRYGSRGHELGNFPHRSLHSSEDVLYGSQTGVVISTKISQRTELSKDGGELTIQHITVKGADGNRGYNSRDNEGQESQHSRSIDLNHKEDPQIAHRPEAKEFT